VASSFEEMNLKPDLLKGIYAYGFEKPSAIQQRAIIPIVQGHDTIAQSQSGTGKTATTGRRNSTFFARASPGTTRRCFPLAFFFACARFARSRTRPTAGT
jgi:hypothetical protein